MKVIKLTAIALSLVSTAAMANVVTTTTNGVVDGGKTLFKTFTNPAAVSAELGTLGYGASVAWSVDPTTEVQAGWTGGNHSLSTVLSTKDLGIGGINLKDITDLGVLSEINADIELRNLAVKANNPYVGVQLRPLANALTIGTGVIHLDNTISAKGAIKNNAPTVTLNGQTYTAQQVADLTASVELKNKLAPYLTVGLRPNLTSRFGVFGEVGAIYAGKPEVTLKSSQQVANTPDSITKKLTEDYQKDANKKISDSFLGKYGAWPLVKVGATVRF